MKEWLGACVWSLFVVCSVLSVYAQDRTVSGRVTGSDEPDGIPGANILIKGTTMGTVTDVNGNYTLSLPAEVGAPVLIVSSVGYVTKNIPVNGRTTIDVVLKIHAEELDEVVVTAYSSEGKSRRSITGSVSTVNTKTVEDQVINSIGQALEGSVPGIRVINSDGRPGAIPTILIRGVASLSGSLSPLIVIDGVPYPAGFNMGAISPNDLESITVLKDASASVLYGSRAAGGVIMYRTRRATRATRPSLSLTYNYGVSSQAVPQYDLTNSDQHMQLSWEALRNRLAQFVVDTDPLYEDYVVRNDRVRMIDWGAMSEEEYRDIRIQAGKLASNWDWFSSFMSNYNPYGTVAPGNQFVSPFTVDETTGDLKFVNVGEDGYVRQDAGNSPADKLDTKWSTDWIGALTNPVQPRRELYLSVRGGESKFRYYVAGSMLNQTGQVIRSYYDRYTGRVNLETDPVPWITLGIGSSYAWDKDANPTQGGSSRRNAVSSARFQPPTYTIYRRDAAGNYVLDQNGKLIIDDGSFGELDEVNRGKPLFGDILTVTRLDDITGQITNVSMSPHLEVRPFKGLSLLTNFGYNYQFANFKSFWNGIVGDAAGVGGRLNESRSTVTNYTWTNTANYNRTFGIHDVSTTVGVELYDNTSSSNSGGKTSLLGPEFSLGATISGLSGSTAKERLARGFLRGEYGLLQRYFIEGGISRDASSRFLSGYRADNFWSAGLSWVVSEEPLFPRNNYLTSLRLRASYGTIGNLSIAGGLFPSRERFSIVSQLDQPGSFRSTIFDENLEWEKSAILNLGVEMSFLRRRLSVDMEYYNKRTVDLVQAQPIARSSGYSSYNTNVGRIQNTGVDVTISSRNIQKRNFSWNSSLVLGFVRNKILALNDTLLGGYGYMWKAGGSRFDLYLPEFAGIDPSTGRSTWYKTDDEGNRVKTFNLTEATNRRSLKNLGSALPDVSGGLNNVFSAYDFSFTVGLSFEFGGLVDGGDYQSLMNPFGGSSADNASPDLFTADRWKNPGDTGKKVGELRLFSSDPLSDRYIYNNDYIRVRTIRLSYNFPRKWTGTAKFVRNVTVSVAANDYFTFWLSKNRPARGFDPQASGIAAGTGLATTYAFKTITTSLNVRF